MSSNSPLTSLEGRKAVIFDISFQTAQFRKHLLKLYRDTYLMPLPSAVAGMVGAIMGIDRQDLREFAKETELYAGSRLISYKGIAEETVTITKIKPGEAIPTPKKSVFVIEPKYRLAISFKYDEAASNLYDRITRHEFVYAIYGGNDYHFVKDISTPQLGIVTASKEGYGYCKLENYVGFVPESDQSFVQIDLVNDSSVTKYVFGLNSKLLLNEPQPVALAPENDRIFLHPAHIFLRSSKEIAKEEEQNAERKRSL